MHAWRQPYELGAELMALGCSPTGRCRDGRRDDRAFVTNHMRNGFFIFRPGEGTNTS